MDDYYGLSELEYQLMQLFLENKEPIGFSEVIHYCNDVKHLNWAATTLHTYLTRLIAKVYCVLTEMATNVLIMQPFQKNSFLISGHKRL